MGLKGRWFSDELKHQDMLTGESQGAVARRHVLAMNTFSKRVKDIDPVIWGEKRPARGRVGLAFGEPPDQGVVGEERVETGVFKKSRGLRM